MRDLSAPSQSHRAVCIIFARHTSLHCFAKRRSAHVRISAQSIPIEMVGRLASACAGRGHWEALTTLLDGAALPSLGAAPGLLAAAAEAGQYGLVARILQMVRSRAHRHGSPGSAMGL